MNRQMKKMIGEYDSYGNEYAIFYSEGTCYLFDCFEFEHDGEPIAQGEYLPLYDKLKAIIQESYDSRF